MRPRVRWQARRFELKYLVPDRLTEEIRRFASSYLEPDEYCCRRPGQASYSVHSLYLDSDDLATYAWTLNGNDVRFKLRIRYYDDEENSLLFFETKKRVNDCILKDRCAVRRQAMSHGEQSLFASAAEIPFNDGDALNGLHRFFTYRDLLSATPKSHVAYEREAWVSREDNSVRVTFDRDIRCQPSLAMLFKTHMEHPYYPYGKTTILELKFTETYPSWLRTLVERCNLMQTEGAKYAAGIEGMGEEHFGTQSPFAALSLPHSCFREERAVALSSQYCYGLVS